MASARNQRIFAIVGLAGTGKSSVVEFLHESLDIPVVYFGGVVVAEVRRRGLEVTEATERQVREELRRDHGMSAIAKLAGDRVAALLDEHDELVIDGLYSYSEYELLDERYPNLISLIAVHATRALREERLAHRAVRPLTPAEIHSRDLREIRTLDKATAITLADWHVVNDSTVADLHRATTTVVDQVRAQRGSQLPA